MKDEKRVGGASEDPSPSGGLLIISGTREKAIKVRPLQLLGEMGGIRDDGNRLADKTHKGRVSLGEIRAIRRHESGKKKDGEGMSGKVKSKRNYLLG